jgi:hypothetical protein
MPKNTIHFALDSDIKEEIIDYCTAHDITMSQFMRWSIINYFEHFQRTILIKENKNEAKVKSRRKAA